MNTGTPHQDDSKWQELLARSASTFAGESAPPYGFMTSTLTRLKSERKEREIWERIGLRALFGAMAMLIAVGGFSLGLQLQERIDFGSGLNKVIQADNITIA